jgi:putative membrane protein
LGWAAVAALTLPLVMAAMGMLPHHWLENLLSPVLGWHGIAVDGNLLTWEAILTYAVVQLAVFAAAYTVIRFTGLKLALTPLATRRAKVHQKALEQFYARGLHLTAARTGVMIFLAVEEHVVEVIADAGIYDKVDKSFWNDTVAILLKHIKAGDTTGGFEEAITVCGAALAQHFPPTDDNPNELPDVLIEI